MRSFHFTRHAIREAVPLCTPLSLLLSSSPNTSCIVLLLSRPLQSFFVSLPSHLPPSSPSFPLTPSFFLNLPSSTTSFHVHLALRFFPPTSAQYRQANSPHHPGSPILTPYFSVYIFQRCLAAEPEFNTNAFLHPSSALLAAMQSHMHSTRPRTASVTTSHKNRELSSTQLTRDYWNVVIGGPQEQGNSQSNRRTSSSQHDNNSVANESAGERCSSAARLTAENTSRSGRTVPILPNGPLQSPNEENDGYRFICQVDGCPNRYKHRSSRSRHKRQCHTHN